MYTWLHQGHRNLASHAMLRKAVDLAAQANALPVNFFDMTDSAALSFLSRWENTGQASLVEQLVRDSLYTCVWEGGDSPRADDHHGFVWALARPACA